MGQFRFVKKGDVFIPFRIQGAFHNHGVEFFEMVKTDVEVRVRISS